MSAFKIGDTVRIIANEANSLNKIGDIGIISELHPNRHARIEVNPKITKCNHSYLTDIELVESKINTKDEQIPWIPQIGEYAIMEAAGGWSYNSENDGCLAIIEAVGKTTPYKNYPISGTVINPKKQSYVKFKNVPISAEKYKGRIICRKATLSEISNVLDSLPKKEQSSSKKIIISKFNIGDVVSTREGYGIVFGYTYAYNICVKGIKGGHNGNGVGVFDRQGNQLYLKGNDYWFFSESALTLSRQMKAGSIPVQEPTWIPKVGDWAYYIGDAVFDDKSKYVHKIRRITEHSLCFEDGSDNGKKWYRKAEPHEIPIKYVMGVDPVDSPSISNVDIMNLAGGEFKWHEPIPTPFYNPSFPSEFSVYEEKSDIIPMQDIILITTKKRKRNLL